MASMDRWGPKGGKIRDPRDTGKKNGPTHNPPRYLTFGGKGPTTDPKMRPTDSSIGPISDRGRGR